LSAMPLTSATCTKISGSSGKVGWKKAKQRRSGPAAGATPRDWRSCARARSGSASPASEAGLFQSIGLKVKKPGLNQPASSSCRSVSTGRSAGWSGKRPSRSRRIATSRRVPSGAMFSRRKSSCRRARRRARRRRSVASSGSRLVGLDGTCHRFAVDVVLLGQWVKKAALAVAVEQPIGLDHLAGQGSTRGFAAGRQELLGQCVGRRRRLPSRPRISSRPASASETKSWLTE
jgi:hypothetical protein